MNNSKFKFIQIKTLSVICLFAVFATMFVFTGCSKENNGNETGNSTSAAEPTTVDNAAYESKDIKKAEIDIKDYGVIKVDLYNDLAPITVANFVKLAKEGFYDGLTFHRIISGFMIQGGDPEGTGMGGSSETIKGEFSSNGFANPIKHTRGVISMARSQDPNSASSQFFIMHEDSPHLDGDYAAFGKVTEGIEIVDKICEDTQVEDSNGTVLKANQPVINSIKIVKE